MSDRWNVRHSPGGIGYAFPLWHPEYEQIVVEGVHGTFYYHTADMKRHGKPDFALMIASEKLGNHFGKPVNPRSGRVQVLALQLVSGTFRGSDYVEMVGKIESRAWIGSNRTDSLILRGIDELMHVESIDRSTGLATLVECERSL